MKDSLRTGVAGGLLLAVLALFVMLATNPEDPPWRYNPPNLEGIWAIRGATRDSGVMTLYLERDTLRPGRWIGYFEREGFRLDVLGGYVPNTRNCWLAGSNSQFDYDFSITLAEDDLAFAGATVTVRERGSTTTYYDGYFSGKRNNARFPTAPRRR